MVATLVGRASYIYRAVGEGKLAQRGGAHDATNAIVLLHYNPLSTAQHVIFIVVI
jgi:hypothetical protein